MSRRKWKQSHGDKTLRSGLEKKLALFLDAKKQSYTYEEEKIEYTVPAKVHKYVPDFVLSDGTVIEVKGRFDPASRAKMAYVVEQNPDRDIRMMFMRDNPINKNSKTKYSDWCEKRGIKYHVSAEGTIPDSWLPKQRRRKRLDE